MLAWDKSIVDEELKKLIYIDASALRGRAVPIFPFINDSGDWEYWHPLPAGLVKIAAIPVHGCYVAKTPQKDSDIRLMFLDFALKRLNYAMVGRYLKAISDDFHNIATSLAKLDCFYDRWRSSKFEMTGFAETEVEYLFSVCRSVFDLLQELVCVLRKQITFNESSIKNKNLPKSFGDMVIASGPSNEKLASSEEIQQRRGIPKEWADQYCEMGVFFKALRSYRDRVIHGGATPDYIFITDRGFALQSKIEPFASFNVWREADMLPNQLASLRPALGYVALKTFEACERFAHMLETTIKWPPDLTPGYHLYIRGVHNAALLQARDAIDGYPWWEQSSSDQSPDH